MLRGYRGDHVTLGLAALIVLLAWSGLVWQIASQRQFYADTAKQQTERAAANAEAEFQDCLTHSARVDLLQCIERVAESKRNAKRAEYDLAAQQEMAFYTPWMMASSIIAAFAAVVGVIYVAGSLREMQTTNEEMARTNEIAHRQLLAGQRPWLKIEVEVKSELSLSAEEYRVSCRAHVVNVGNSPAFGYGLVFVPKYFPQRDAPTSDLLFETAENAKTKHAVNNALSAAIFPGEESGWHEIGFRFPSSIDDITHFQTEFIIVATYKSGLDEEVHQTGRVYMLIVRSAPFDGPVPKDEIKIAKHS